MKVVGRFGALTVNNPVMNVESVESAYALENGLRDPVLRGAR